MKNQYFGDINDYKKYSVIKIICADEIKPFFEWMLTKNDKKNDGNLTSYLCKPEKWEKYDPKLFSILGRIIKTAITKKNRNVGLLKTSNYFKTIFSHETILTDDISERKEWFNELLKKSSKFDFVFFDPDNGLEIQSVRKGNRNSSKYIYWDEISKIWNKNKTLLIYQHFPMVKRKEYISNFYKEIIKKLKTKSIYSIRTSKFVFFLIVNKKYRHTINKRIGNIDKIWDKVIQVERYK